MKKRVWAWLMTLIMIVTMVPASAFAADEPADASPYTVTNQDAIQPDQTGGVYLNKQLELDSNGEGYITLETYVEGKVKTSSKAVDFIMVLDMSTSMRESFSKQQTTYTEVYTLDKNDSYYVRTDYGYTEVEWCDNCNAWTDGCWGVISHHSGDKYTPRTAAGQAGTQFYTAETVASMTRLEALKSAATNFVGTVASDTGDHRIALVGFENDASILTGDPVQSAFKDASDNETGLKNIIGGISSYDLEPATEHGKGLELAESILAADTSTDRERVVILFTDGEPEPNNSSSWSSDIVSGAVNSAYKLKNTHNASVYCISVLPGAASAGTSYMDKYMNYVSSNYKNAKYEGTYSGTNKDSIINAITPGEGTYGGKYYQVASDMAKLEDIFGSISSDVQKIELDEETIVTDVMSEYFTVNGAAGDVQLYVSPYTGEDSDGAAQFGERTAAEGVTASIENGVVSVSGFDFEPVMNNDDGTAKSGKMLTIVVPVKLDAEATEGMSGETVPSNNTEEAKASIINDDATVAEFAIPAVTLPKEKIVITANSDTKVYDGTALKNAGYTYTEGVLADSDVLTAVVEGSQTDAGESANVVASYKVMRGDVDVTDKYDITTVKGTLKVTPRPVTLTSATDSKVYDGTALTNDKITVSGDGFVKGEGASYDVTGSQLDAGSSDNTFTYKLNVGTKAENYNITTEEGTLTVTNRANPYEITVEANSGEYLYDGEEKTAEGFKTLAFTLNGQTYSASGLTAKTTETDAGTYPVNVVGTAVVKDADGNDVTDQFKVTIVNGSLTINKRVVTLTSATDSKQYDGTPLKNANVAVDGDGFADGEGSAYTVTGSQTLVGSSENYFTYELNAGTNADNYEISTANGTLTVVNRDAKYLIEVEAN
ncbi:MAG: VWA domain-containing protein, partial [Firmicutes bacterium]|nr:VWA domain-containing protein [Bacillota bacterium]